MCPAADTWAVSCLGCRKQCPVHVGVQHAVSELSTGPLLSQERSVARGSACVLIPVAFLLGTRGSVVAFVAVLQPVFPIGVRGSQVHSEGFIFTTPRPPGLGCQRVTAASALPGSAWASEFWMAGEEVLMARGPSGRRRAH